MNYEKNVFIKNLIIISYFIICITIKKIICQINDNFNYGILEQERSSILDVADYLNLSLIVTSSKKMYNAIPFSTSPRMTTSANLNSSSAIAVCNENYLIAGCLVDYLLVKIKINDGTFTQLVEYSEFSSIIVTDKASSCCVTIYDNIVFIAISQPGTDDKIKNSVIKLNIMNKDDSINGPIIDNSVSKILFDFPVEYQKTGTTRDVSCEALLEQTSNDYRLLCAYENKEGENKIVYLASINFNIENNFEKNVIIAQVPYEYGFRLYKLDNYYLRLVLRTGVYDIKLNSNFDIISNNVNNKLRTYNSYWNLFTYHNNRVITYLTGYCIDYAGNSVRCSDMRIYTPDDDDYYLIITYSNLDEAHTKMYNYYDDNSDYLTILYQSASKIYYITFQDNKDIYKITSSSAILRVKSNEEIDFDISNLIESSRDFGKLYIGQSITMYSSDTSETITLRYPYESISFPVDKDTQILNLETSSNLWYEFTLAYTYINEDYARVFFLPNAKLSIRTCAFQCGSCTTDYYICDTCRDSNYAKKSNTENSDPNCYPINQIFEGYIYNSNTNQFEKCYSTCKFCSLSGSESSATNHNCLSCAEGYIPSYEFLGNCYQKIETEEKIIVNSISDSVFSTISICSLSSKNYIISSTNECVTQCPETIPYNSYICNSIDFTEQEYGKTLPSECTATQLNPPKLFLGNYCYESCPSNSEKIESTNECKCSNAWHKDTTTEEIICYEENYCKYDRYKYYLSDTKECTNSCPSGYFQFNFQCYLTGCPSDTTLIDSNKCESNYNYCYINQYYQNICSNEKDNSYLYNYDNTKQYLKECSESLTYTISEAKTYLYQGVCYLTCPENTINNDEENKCNCLYFGYYSETDETDYNCYNEEEKCNDKIPVNDIKICLDSINDCITKGYKIFNNECYSENCPENTEIKNSNDNYCLCKYYFYNNNGMLNCYDSTVTSCEEKSYEYSNPITLECFDSLEDCFNKDSNYFFNKFCYKDTCSEQIALSSITDEAIKNDFITNLNIRDEDINRICVCNIFNENINWDFSIEDGVYSQECVNSCKAEYEPNLISKRCFESCLDYKHYMFNDDCYYDGCPTNTKLREENGHVCICENYFLNNDNNELECYNSLEECQNNNILYYNEESKQCFSSLDNCFSNNFNYFFNNKCYNDGCPPGTISLSDISNDSIKNKFINYLEINNDLINKICVCDIITDANLKWTYNYNTKEQECVNNCNEEIYELEPEQITHKCVDKCNPLTDYVFNNICYKYSCPGGTKLKNDGTRICICENSYYIEGNTMICCNSENEDDINCIGNIVYPKEYYENPDKCQAVYNNKCYSSCPEGTCLTQKDINLIFCIKTESYMTVFNGICFTDFEEIETNIKKISDNDEYIIPSPNVTIKAYSTDTKIDEINSNYSYIELGECENTLKDYYDLQPETLLYILGVETPNKDKQSSINVYNYGVYLENGTKLDLSICNGTKISIYSTITNKSLIKLDEANHFNSYGYDIFNESDNFYTDVCSPASIDGNDITLSDRYNDFYPSNVSLCNDSCELEIVNLTSEKIKCECDVIYNDSDTNLTSEDDEEFSYTYLEYFLSLVNYKILFCQKLLLTPSNYLKNIGFYVGSIITLFCIIQMVINLTSGIRSLNKIIKENEPSKAKLEERKKEQFKKIKENIENIKEENTNKKKKILMTNLKETNMNKKKYLKTINSPPRNRSSTIPKNKKKGIETETLEIKKKKVIKKGVGINGKEEINALSKKEIPFILLKSRNKKEKEKEKGKDTLKKSLFDSHNKFIKKSTKNKKNFLDLKNKKERFINETTTPFSKDKLKNKQKNNKVICNESEIEPKNKKRKRLSKYLYLDSMNNDEIIDKKELNEVPYTQAIRIDNRSIWEIFLYTIANKIEIINIFYYKNTYVHLSMSISLYFFSFLLDVSLNCFLYTDDVVSEKYHNEGSLETLTSLSLSFASNIISSILTFFLRKLGEYSDILEIMISDITIKRYYYINMIKFRKFLKIRLSFFYIFQFIMCILMTYYITIFCIIYSQSQVSIMINYIYGVLESLAISFGITIIITIMRYLSIKNKWINIYRSSQYLYNKF